MDIRLPDTKQTESVHFTGDKKVTEIFCENYSYILMKMDLRIYPFKSKTPYTVRTEYKLMSFQGKTSVILGEIIEPYFYKPKSLKEIYDFSNFSKSEIIELYKPIEVDIVFQEFNYNSDNKIGEQSVFNIQFLRGKSAAVSTFKKGEKSRVGSNSLLAFPIYKNLPSEFLLNKNGKNLHTLTTKEKILTSFFYQDLTALPGDVYDLLTKGTDLLEKKVVFPRGIQSYHIIWLDENLALRIFEFTGKFTSKPVHDLIFNTYSSDGKKITHTIEDKPGQNMVLNTGFILPEDISVIESIIGNLKAWISFDQLRTFTSFYLNTKELEYNSEQNLYNFDLEVSLNYEDKENHYDKGTEPEYDLIFKYRATPDINNSIDLGNAFNNQQAPDLVDWGDSKVNSDLSHIYTNPGEYTVKVKIPNLTQLYFSNSHVFEISKLPASLSNIDCMGCMFSEPAINQLLSLVLAHNPTYGNSGTVYGNNEYGIIFLKYIHIGNQKPAVILSQDSINKAKQLLDKQWLIDYFSYFQASGIPTSSRYQNPDYAKKSWPENCMFFVSSGYAIYQKQEVTISLTVDPKGTNIDKSMWNYYGVLRQENDGTWMVIKVLLGEITMGSFYIAFTTGPMGPHAYKIGQLKYPKNVAFPEYSFMWLKDFTLDTIDEKSVLIADYDDWQVNIEGAPNTEFFNIYSSRTPAYVGMGNGNRIEPSIKFLPQGSNLSQNAKDQFCWIAPTAGNYKFTFINYTLDFNNLLGKMSVLPTFCLAYYDAAGSINLSSPTNPDINGTITVNKEIVLNLSAGAKIVPLFTGTWKTPLSFINGFVTIRKDSRLIIEKI